MADNFSVEEIEELQKVFSLHKNDGDEKIARDELRAIVKSLGDDPSDEELEELMSEVGVKISDSQI